MNGLTATTLSLVSKRASKTAKRHVWDTHLDTEANPVRKPNHFSPKLMEAVGIEPASVDPVRHDSVAITRNDMVGETMVNRSKPELGDHPRTCVPNGDIIDSWVRRLWRALRVV